MSIIDGVLLLTFSFSLCFALLSEPQLFPGSRAERFFVAWGRWLSIDVWPVWVGALILAIAFCMIDLLGGSQRAVRWIGWGFELFGLVIAIVGVLKIRVSHGLPSYTQQIVSWWKSRPRWNRSASANISGVSRISISGNATLSVWNNDDPNLDVLARLEKLIRNVDFLKNEQSSMQNNIQRIDSKVSAVEGEVKRSHEQLRQEFLDRMRKLDTDGAGLALVGFLLIGLGLTFTTLTEEIWCFYTLFLIG